jgi:hypothetical protein
LLSFELINRSILKTNYLCVFNAYRTSAENSWRCGEGPGSEIWQRAIGLVVHECPEGSTVFIFKGVVTRHYNPDERTP